jgi:hypothetical protein
MNMNDVQRAEPVSFYQLITCLVWETLKAILWGIVIILAGAITPLAPGLGYGLVRLWVKTANKLDKKTVKIYS